jgi:hypothetical protein
MAKLREISIPYGWTPNRKGAAEVFLIALGIHMTEARPLFLRVPQRPTQTDVRVFAPSFLTGLMSAESA